MIQSQEIIGLLPGIWWFLLCWKRQDLHLKVSVLCTSSPAPYVGSVASVSGHLHPSTILDGQVNSRSDFTLCGNLKSEIFFCFSLSSFFNLLHSLTLSLCLCLPFLLSHCHCLSHIPLVHLVACDILYHSRLIPKHTRDIPYYHHWFSSQRQVHGVRFQHCLKSVCAIAKVAMRRGLIKAVLTKQCCNLDSG